MRSMRYRGSGNTGECRERSEPWGTHFTELFEEWSCESKSLRPSSEEESRTNSIKHPTSRCYMPTQGRYRRLHLPSKNENRHTSFILTYAGWLCRSRIESAVQFLLRQV